MENLEWQCWSSYNCLWFYMPLVCLPATWKLIFIILVTSSFQDYGIVVGFLSSEVDHFVYQKCHCFFCGIEKHSSELSCSCLDNSLSHIFHNPTYNMYAKPWIIAQTMHYNYRRQWHCRSINHHQLQALDVFTKYIFFRLKKCAQHIALHWQFLEI